jgi:hypothetical protein
MIAGEKLHTNEAIMQWNEAPPGPSFANHLGMNKLLPITITLLAIFLANASAKADILSYLLH